ncbi:MAG: hypothetical protein Q9211_005836 [Gyalolechia sp. 1 TL-2023]
MYVKYPFPCPAAQAGTSNIDPVNLTSAPSTNLFRIQTPKSAEILYPIGPQSKNSTPVPTSVPPGLSLPQDFPPLAAPSIPAPVPQKSQRKAGPSAILANVVKPVVPVVPSQATKGPSTLVAGDGTTEPTAAKGDSQAKWASSSMEPVPKPKSRKEAASYEKMGPPRTKKHSKSGEPSASSDGKTVKELPERSSQATGKSSRESEKRHPGKLNLEATKNKPLDKARPTDTSGLSRQAHEEVPASTTTAPAVAQPETPVTVASQASGVNVGKNGQPRTIRVLPTSKNESPLKGSATAVSRDENNVSSANLLSRRGSLSSMNPPGTPVSERISDNVSMTSTSLSRANSPPPSNFGTAPARHLTKNQQKKERQARAKQAEQATMVDEPAVKTEVEGPVQAPIVGRKKKQKKPASRGTADTTPVITRPPSPQPHDEDLQETEEPGPSTPVRSGKKDEAKAALEPEAETFFSPTGPSTSEQPPKNTLNAAALFSALQKSHQISSAALDIFKPVIGLNHRFDIDAQSLDHISEVGLPALSDEQNEQIERSEPVCMDQGNGRSIIVLPDRRTLRGLTIEQANRYLELRKEALDTSDLLHLAGHGPAPPKPPTPPSSLISSNGAHLPNPFLSESQTQSPATNVSRLPQAFGSVGSANPTTYVDEAAAFIATRREKAGGVMGVEDAEQAFASSRKETEGLEKRLNALLKRNRRLVLGSVGN